MPTDAQNMRIAKYSPPCRDCPKRREHCHSTCAAYKIMQEMNERCKRKRIIESQKTAKTVTHERTIRSAEMDAMRDNRNGRARRASY